MITLPQLGWMAGVYDMKGRSRRLFAPSRTTPLFTIMVESSQLHVVRQLSRLTGTRVAYSEKRMLGPAIRRGCIEHCPEAHLHVNPVIPTVGRWHISGAGAITVLHNLLPFLTGDTSTKTVEFIDDAYTWIDPHKKQGRHAIQQSMRRLAGLGWQIPPELGL